MTARIHRTAIVDKGAELGTDVDVGPGAIIGPRCVVGNGARIAPRAILEQRVTLGAGVKIGVGSVIGGDPQDLKWQGEETSVEIGDRTVVREYATINRATSHSWKTVVGADCFLMSYVHLAHDCQLGDGVIISNGTQLAGHVVIDARAIISGLCAVHQFVRIGRHAFIGGCSRVTKDIPPFVKAVGNPVKLYGLNSVGLQRAGFPEATVRELKRVYRLCFNSELNITQAVSRARSDGALIPDVEQFIAFVAASARGVAF